MHIFTKMWPPSQRRSEGFHPEILALGPRSHIVEFVEFIPIYMPKLYGCV